MLSLFTDSLSSLSDWAQLIYLLGCHKTKAISMHSQLNVLYEEVV